MHGGRKQAIVAKAHLNLVAPGSRFRVVIVVVIVVGVAVVVVAVAATATALCTYYIDYYVSIYLLPNSTLQIIRPKALDFRGVSSNCLQYLCVIHKTAKKKQKTPFWNHHLFCVSLYFHPLGCHFGAPPEQCQFAHVQLTTLISKEPWALGS